MQAIPPSPNGTPLPRNRPHRARARGRPTPRRGLRRLLSPPRPRPHTRTRSYLYASNRTIGGTPDEGYLVALGAVSGGMVVYKRVGGGADFNLAEVEWNASAVPSTGVVMREVAL
ncbi:hypothetical protein K438DRAFT_1976552 [Mycena galopus ATCC 62051]|nr:hypothetical protein K438DRAFT_1976552 [Mycena galopus ATCC 62051]